MITESLDVRYTILTKIFLIIKIWFLDNIMHIMITQRSNYNLHKRQTVYKCKVMHSVASIESSRYGPRI